MKLRSILSVLLAVSLALTTVGMGGARGAMASTQSVVICAGGEPVRMLLDSHGQPVEPAPHCPDCVIGALAVAPAPAGAGQPEYLSSTLHVTLRQDGRTGRSAPIAVARGPPQA
ncbi:MAG: hypothetical protein HUJ27_13245 [Rhodobacteraceae bacterium]|nr:hypothetical protein [Paracoccaceae bacterium]